MMNYDPHQKTRAAVLDYFTANAADFPGVRQGLEAFFAAPSLGNAKALMGLYFSLHRKDDIPSLQMITSSFADKTLVKGIVDSILADDEALDDIARHSYPHPIGFDKLVLYNDPGGFKFRLHIYWRGNQRAAMERMHLHRFEMASAIVTGELTNHTWRVAGYRPEGELLPRMEITADTGDATTTRPMVAYSGYWRDPQGQLHKKLLGECEVVRGESDTFVSGQSYAQILSDAHYVETNAETGKTNGDVCSTIYIHSKGLIDHEGRKMPVLFEDARLAASDQIIDPIPAMTTESLKTSLTHYSNFLQESLDFYKWLYDPKHGRDLSAGMVAGYLLSESLGSPHTISTWIAHESDCKATLDACSATLGRLIDGTARLADLSDDDRKKRYYALLLDKAARYAKGPQQWQALYGDLSREMWRYCGALKGEKPDITVLKPIWMEVVGKKMPGGAHYGHVAAMIEAAYTANDVALGKFKAGLASQFKADGSPFSDADCEIETLIRDKLAEHFPSYRFYGEEAGDSSDADPVEGDRRWLVDSLDGSRNFLGGRSDFCISLACQRFIDGAWDTTDAVVSLPVGGKIFWAEQGKGAYLIERDDFEHELRVAPASADDTLKNRLVDISISGFGIDGETDIIRALRSQGAVYRATGSAAMMLAMVAGEGSEGAIITANDYDVAGAELIAREAGAAISRVPFARETPQGARTFQALVAGASPALHERLEQVARQAAALAEQEAKRASQPVVRLSPEL